MHQAPRALLVALIVVLSGACAPEEPAKPATPVASVPTLLRPPLRTASALPSVSPLRLSPSPSAGASEGQTYTVQSGDTLSSIASRFYHDASAWRPIFEANRDRLNGPESLRTGMVLRIPPVGPTPVGTPRR
jgi:nucleoid-associated protein YgaU